MVLILTANTPIIFSGQEVTYGSGVSTPQAASKIITRTANTPLTYSGQEVIES